MGTPEGAVREMGATGCAGGAVTGGWGGGGALGVPSKDSVCVRCVGKLGRGAFGATTGGRGDAPNGGTT